MGIQIRKRVQNRRKEGLDLYKGITEYFEHSLHPFSLRGKKLTIHISYWIYLSMTFSSTRRPAKSESGDSIPNFSCHRFWSGRAYCQTAVIIVISTSDFIISIHWCNTLFCDFGIIYFRWRRRREWRWDRGTSQSWSFACGAGPNSVVVDSCAPATGSEAEENYSRSGRGCHQTK